jgi:prophage tail gpP-like protein
MPKYRGEENRSKARDPATPGHFYVIKGDGPGPLKDDSLSRIAAIAYGDGKLWRKTLWKANKGIARDWKNPDTGQYELNPNYSFWPGDVIFVPGDPIDEVREEQREDLEEKLPDAKDGTIVVIIDGNRVPVATGSVLLSADTAADGWAITTAFNKDNQLHRELFKPYAYHPAECYLEGDLVIRGKCYKTRTSLSLQGGRAVELGGWGYPADVIDSMVSSPLERSNVTLEERARELCEPLGVDVVYEAFIETPSGQEKDDEKFDRVTAEKTQTRLEHMRELADQRGLQISSTNQGKLLIYRPAENLSPVYVIEEGKPPFGDLNVTYDGRERFHSVTVTSQSPGKNSETATATDSAVPQSRFITISADDTQRGGLQKAAEWELSKQFRDAMTFEIVANGWKIPGKSERWSPNTIVTVISPTAFIANGFDFFIKNVEYKQEAEKRTAILTLVPPQVFTGEPIPDLWS